MKTLGIASLFFATALFMGCSDDDNPPPDQGGPDGGADIGADIGTDVVMDIEVLPDEGTDGTVEPPAYTAAKGVRGGKLYDKWWEVISATPPPGEHALYPTSGTKTGDATWRCKECHGWDYRGKDGTYKTGSHATGIKGVLGSTKTIQEMFDLIKTNHGLGGSGKMADADIWDLVKFLKTKLIDTTTYINDTDKKSKGDLTKGKTNFTATCGASTCHGTDARKINFKPAPYGFEFLPGLATEDPWEALHKARFGQPDNMMPASTATTAEINDALAYIQSLEVAAFSTANLKRGGKLYDKWWKVNSATAPTGEHVLYPTTSTKTGDTTWRCKECHGWDYKGKDGAYATGSHATGIKGVMGTLMDPQAIFDMLKTGTHKFGAAGLADADIWDLVLFVKAVPYDQATYIDAAAKTFKGDKAKGKTNFDGKCSSCHGTDGKKLNFGTTAVPEYVGNVAGNPQELMHKLLFGDPTATSMPDADTLKWSLQDAADTGAHAATLPTN